MNKTILMPLFTMLVVSCGVALPSSESSSNSLSESQVESSLISQTTSSSNSPTTSSSGSSSVEPVSTRKVPFNQIGSLVAQVVDAKAMGVVNSKDRPQVSGRKSAQEEDQNYMVKVTETYNPNTEITEDQTVQVTFSRVTNTQTTELQTGTESYVATAEALEIERLTDLPGNIVITNVEGYEFRLLSEEVVVQDWIRSELETLEFIFDEALTGITLESRSFNASISFIAFEGFTYMIKQGETVIYEDLQDNDDADNNQALGNITLSGLTEGLTYEVTYEGYQVIETITQDEVEGQVDKLYVLYQYTFISFVPLNLNNRPQDQDLELDYDDVPLYDKEGYFSDSTRQSFVVDNETGLIYKIENISITSLSGGCVSVQDSPFPFDMRLSDDGNLDFYTIHQNSTINTFSCLKDKYGNKFIQNSRLNVFDSETSTHYYSISMENQFNRNVFYQMTSLGEVIKVTMSGDDWHAYEFYNRPLNAEITLGNNQFRSLNESDNFDIYYLYQGIGYKENIYKVEDGKLYGFNEMDGFSSFFKFYVFDSSTSTTFSHTNWFTNASNGTSFNSRFFKKYGIIIESSEGELNYFTNIMGLVKENYLSENNVAITPGGYSYWWNTSYKDTFETSKINVLDNVVIEYNKIIKYGITNNIEYELVFEVLDNEPSINAYVVGTYVAPPATSITLQPINK